MGRVFLFMKIKPIDVTVKGKVLYVDLTPEEYKKALSGWGISIPNPGISLDDVKYLRLWSMNTQTHKAIEGHVQVLHAIATDEEIDIGFEP